MEEFHKVRRLPPYVFEQVNRLKASARSRGADIIDLGMGNPDLPTPKAIVDKLCEVVRDPRTHRYSSSRGIPGLRRAQASYYARRFGVKLDPGHAGRRDARLQGRLRQHGAGDHRARRRDPVPQPDLSDPRLRLHHVGRRHPLAAGRAGRRLHPGAGARHPPFDPEAAGADPQLSVEPDGAWSPSLDFYKDVVAFAKKNDIIILSDLAYSEIYFDGNAAALGAAGAGRDRHRGRVHLDVEDLLHARLAHGLCGRQRAADRGADAGEILSRLRRLHADPGGGGRRAQRRRRRHRRGARRLPASAAT